MPDFPIIDSHVHLCKPDNINYTWMSGAPQLARLVLPEHLNEAAAPVKVEKLVFVEVDCDPHDRLSEAKWIAELAETHPQIGAIVGSLPLEHGEAVLPMLEEMKQTRLLRGVRRLIQSEPDDAFCLRPDFVKGVQLLGKHGLSFDICVYHRQLGNAAEMARRCDGTRIVLDHIGKPGIKDRLMDPWRQHMRDMAALPHVSCKISGVITEADHKNWKPTQIRPYIEHAISCFGFDRVMFGGDWHVLELAATYPQWVAVVDDILAGASADEKRKFYRDNAARFYRFNES
jgi:L-fuconolactonase